MDPVLCLNLNEQPFSGPDEGRGAYCSFSILNPAITIERHGGEYHVTARFNLETTILGYEEQKNENHEWFFNDICLQYKHDTDDEDLITKPDSDPATAFTVTTNHYTSISGQIGAKTPSASVQLDVSHSTGLTVQYALTTWTLSANKVVKVEGKLRARGRREFLNRMVRKQPLGDCVRYQWFWKGTQGETRTLTPDLTQTVKRHVLVKRKIPIKKFPGEERIKREKIDLAKREIKKLEKEELEAMELEKKKATKAGKKKETEDKGVDEDDDNCEELLRDLEQERERENQKADAGRIKSAEFKNQMADMTGAEAHMQVRSEEDDGVSGNDSKKSLEDLLIFSFQIHIKVKQRYGRIHRLFVLSWNKKKGEILEPTFKKGFEIKANLLKVDEKQIPRGDTIDIMAELAKIKDKNEGKWDDLQGKSMTDVEVRQDQPAELGAPPSVGGRTYKDFLNVTDA